MKIKEWKLVLNRKNTLHNENPLVSVITPSYNSLSFIEETIKSVKAQSYSNWEMLIVDDYSQDGSREIIRKYAEVDKRIKLISLSENGGVAKARNVALQEAKGDYVAFLDSDDLWLPQKLEKQVAFMREGNIAFSFTSYTVIEEGGHTLAMDIHVPQKVTYEHLLGNTIIGCLTVMLDRKKLQQIQMPLIQPEDTALWLLLLRQGFQAHGLPEILSKYRIVKNSISRNKFKAAYRYWKLIRIQENLNLLRANFYFSKYAYHALMKNRKVQSAFVQEARGSEEKLCSITDR